MKKIFAALLALCMLGGAAAMAEDNTITETSASKTATTTVNLNVEGSYTVTIPASVTIDAKTRTGACKVTVAEKPILQSGKSLYISVTPAGANGAATYLKNGGIWVYYRMYNGNSTTAISRETVILTVAAGAPETSTTLNFIIPEETSIRYAGTYTETLTFTVAEKR